jgi:cytochrome b561
MKTSQGYTMLQIGLHWLIAAGVVFNYIFSDGSGLVDQVHAVLAPSDSSFRST